MKPLILLGLRAMESSFPRRNDQLSLLFPESVPAFGRARHIFDVPRFTDSTFVSSTADRGVLRFKQPGRANPETCSNSSFDQKSSSLTTRKQNG